jgi:hypothetical protein
VFTKVDYRTCRRRRLPPHIAGQTNARLAGVSIETAAEGSTEKARAKRITEKRRVSVRRAHEAHLRQAAERHAQDPVAVDRSLRILRAWAQQQAASLPPMTDQQVAVAAQLAAELDAKHGRRSGDDAA